MQQTLSGLKPNLWDAARESHWAEDVIRCWEYLWATGCGTTGVAAFRWCFSTSKELRSNAKIIVHTSNITMRKWQTALHLWLNFKARTYNNTQYRPHRWSMDSSIPSYSKWRTWSRECTNAGIIRLFDLGCIYTLAPKCHPTSVFCRLWRCRHIGCTFFLEIIVQFRAATSTVTCSTESVRWNSCLHCQASLLSRAESPLDQAHLLSACAEYSGDSFMPISSQPWHWDSLTRWFGYLLVHGLGLEFVIHIRVPASRH